MFIISHFGGKVYELYFSDLFGGINCTFTYFPFLTSEKSHTSFTADFDFTYSDNILFHYDVSFKRLGRFRVFCSRNVHCIFHTRLRCLLGSLWCYKVNQTKEEKR